MANAKDELQIDPYRDVPPNPEFVDGVASNDIVLNNDLGLWVRIYHPQAPQGQDLKFPILIYYHGGGFVHASAATFLFHRFAEKLSSKLGSIIVSVSYRLAPKHKLPAAYEDGYSVLEWIAKSSAGKEHFSSIHGNLSKIFVAGDSAGGNLAANVALRAARDGIELAGQILLQPFYGGVARTESEIQHGEGQFFNLESCDLCWGQALPEGADRDHPYCNPAVDLPRQLAELGSGKLARALVVVGGRDLLRDRQVEFWKILERGGAAAKLVEYENATHAFYLVLDGEESVVLMDELLHFFQGK